ncbi:MAG: hypothetical protein R3B91_04285 [Planctomycetaceae bacterium]
MFTNARRVHGSELLTGTIWFIRFDLLHPLRSAFLFDVLTLSMVRKGRIPLRASNVLPRSINDVWLLPLAVL